MNTGIFTIKAAATRSGLTPFLIRAWERRYNVVNPLRTASNQRRYTRTHVEKLTKLRQIVDAGFRIGDVAMLNTEELDRIVARIQPAIEEIKSAEAVIPSPVQCKPEPISDLSASEYIQKSLRCVEEMNESCLESLLSRASISISQVSFLDSVILPLTRLIGDKWHSGDIRISQEHMATWVIKAILSGILRSHRPAVNAPMMVVTTPAGQRHEIGALAVAISGTHCGWSITYLGPDLPAEEIAAMVIKTRARIVALSIVYPGDDPLLPGELSRLRNLLPQTVTIVTGGSAAINYQEKMDRLGIRNFSTLKKFRTYLTSNPSLLSTRTNDRE